LNYQRSMICTDRIIADVYFQKIKVLNRNNENQSNEIKIIKSKYLKTK